MRDAEEGEGQAGGQEAGCGQAVIGLEAKRRLGLGSSKSRGALAGAPPPEAGGEPDDRAEK